jgi:predicted nuclease with TOPRIM domain
MTTAWDDLAAENARLRKELEEREGELEQCRAQVKALVKTLARAEEPA